MSLSQQQQIFAKNLGKFLELIYQEPGYSCVIGEVKRPHEMQELYIKQGKTKISHSKHEDCLAVDIALFINGEYKTQSEDYARLGELWKSLDSQNVWGGDWKSFHDGNHFQYGV